MNNSLNVLATEPGLPARHPCFEKDAKHRYARLHLAVAPRCNVQCNYCDRRHDCPNESRPGVAARLLKPQEAVGTIRSALDRGVPLSVVGIAGPGDPLANPKETFEVLHLVRKQFPSLLLCLSTNGTALKEWLPKLEELGVSHLTVTLNAVVPEVAAQVYAWVRLRGIVYVGADAGKVALDAQLEGLSEAVRRGFITKVNTVIIPGVTDVHALQVARVAAEIGVDLQNCIPLIPVPGTPLATVTTPSPQVMQAVREQCGAFLPQMSHCTRCRADACGLLGQQI